MVTLCLSIPSPVFIGPVSVNTVAPILALRETMGCGLAEAKGYIDRCVFEGETVRLGFRSRDEAVAVQRALLASAPGLLVVTLEE